MRITQFSLCIAWVSTMVPVVAAQTAREEVLRIKNVLNDFELLFSGFIILAILLAFLFFFWNIAVFILKIGGNEAKVFEEVKRRILWGIIALFVLVSIWGIIYFFAVILLGSNAGDKGPNRRGVPNIQTFRLPGGQRLPEMIEEPRVPERHQSTVMIGDDADSGTRVIGDPSDLGTRMIGDPSDLSTGNLHYDPNLGTGRLYYDSNLGTTIFESDSGTVITDYNL